MEKLEVLGSTAYEIYKKNVNSITFNGEKMKEFYELPSYIQRAWSAIDLFYRGGYVLQQEKIN
jgi:hypothetical protein